MSGLVSGSHCSTVPMVHTGRTGHTGLMVHTGRTVPMVRTVHTDRTVPMVRMVHTGRTVPMVRMVHTGRTVPMVRMAHTGRTVPMVHTDLMAPMVRTGLMVPMVHTALTVPRLSRFPRPVVEAQASTTNLTVTRACNLRCSYCPTVKDGWPSLSPDQARQAVRLFVDHTVAAPSKCSAVNRYYPRRRPGRHGGGRKDLLIGLCSRPTDWVSTVCLERLRASKKSILTLSMDGHPDDHRKLRRALNDIPDAYDHVVSYSTNCIERPSRSPKPSLRPQPLVPIALQHLRALGLKGSIYCLAISFRGGRNNWTDSPWGSKPSAKSS